MKINLYILKAELVSYNLSSAFTDEPATLLVDNAIPYLGNMSFRQNTVYVANAAVLPPNPSIVGHPSLICVGEPPEVYKQEPFNILWTQETDILALIKSVLEIFNRYHHWGEDMLRIVADNRPLKDIAVASLPFIDNPICVSRPNFKILFHVMNPRHKLSKAQYKAYCEDYGENKVPVPDGIFLQPENIEAMITDSRYLTIIEATNPTISSLGDDNFRTLCKNIRTSDGTCFARLLIDEIYHEFTDKDYALLEILDSYLEECIQIQDVDDRIRPSGQDELMENMLRKQPFDEQALKGVLGFYSWKSDDSFLCVVLESKSFEQDTEKLESFAAQVLPNLLSDLSCVFDNRLVIVFNLSQTGFSRDDTLEHILPHLRDGLFIVGVGSSFIGFRNLCDYYLQAIDALSVGKKKDPFHWVFRAENYQTESMLLRCKDGRDTETLLPDGLKLLRNHDREKDTDYCTFLRFYIESGLNIADTGRAFFLHRNTCVYRIKRIHEITHLDLNDAKTRFELELAFRLNDLQ